MGLGGNKMIQEREIPAGKILLADFADAKGQMSQVSIIDTLVDSDNNRCWYFKQHEPGFEPAGSMARWTNRKWSVTHFDYLCNATFGKSFKGKAEAKAYFQSLETEMLNRCVK
jgi:hypothetical protein